MLRRGAREEEEDEEEGGRAGAFAGDREPRPGPASPGAALPLLLMCGEGEEEGRGGGSRPLAPPSRKSLRLSSFRRNKRARLGFARRVNPGCGLLD